MVLEATVVCLDNSEWMRNGDYTPSRLEAQQDAINLICGAKTESNPENTVAVVACSGKSPEVLVTLTGDLGKVLSSLHQVKIGPQLNFPAGIQVAQLALKHRQNKNQHQRVVFFVGSPVEADTEELVRLGKRLKKNNVAVDVVNFGEEARNTDKLEAFISAVTSNDNSHLVNIPPGPHILSDILLSSPIITGEEGVGGAGAASRSDFGGFGVDPNMDPELALALRASMEEERARQEAARKKEEEANRPPGTEAPATSTTSAPSGDVSMADVDADDELAQALAMSVREQQAASSTPVPAPTTSAPVTTPAPDSQDVDMSEDDEMALALQMSMQEANKAKSSSSAPSTSATSTSAKPDTQSDVNRVMEDPNFVNSVLATLPGVDPNDERIKSVLAALGKKPDDKKDEKK